MWLELLTVMAAAGSLLVAGFFLAFAATVLPALGSDPRRGATVMRRINGFAVRPPFMILFFGTAALSGVTLARGFAAGEPGLVLGAAFYFCAVAGTIVGNVPLNDALAHAAEDDDAAWAVFTRPWARLNLLRMILAATGGVLLMLTALL